MVFILKAWKFFCTTVTAVCLFAGTYHLTVRFSGSDSYYDGGFILIFIALWTCIGIAMNIDAEEAHKEVKSLKERVEFYKGEVHRLEKINEDDKSKEE